MYLGAAVVDVADELSPGGPPLALFPFVAALALAVVLWAVGPRLPHAVLGSAAPIGATLIAIAMSGLVDRPNAGAILYIWPVIWMSFFFGRRGAVFIVAWIAVAQAVAVVWLPGSFEHLDLWIDTVVGTGVLAVVIQVLGARNRELMAVLAAEARVDPLTGLLNRRGFDERSPLELARAVRNGDSVAIVIFDLDGFKLVNDDYGHEAGDRALEVVGRTLCGHARATDLIARTGGDEFVALLPTAEETDAFEFAERIRATLLSTHEAGLPPVRLSAGVAAAQAPTELAPLLRAADTALYAAKRNGRDRSGVASAEDSRIARGRLGLTR
jgi:diguanylate cyclase (GGDEF)-like protein